MQIIAHRGYSADHPENTPASWYAAYLAGAYAIEADIRFSADGIGICAHDPTLDRLFGRPERADTLTFAELSALHNAEGGRIAPLADVLDYAATGKPVLLDLKDESPHGLERLSQAIQERVPPQDRALLIVGCHTLVAVEFFAALGGVTILGFILDKDAGAGFSAAGAKIIRLWESDVTPERMTALKALGAQIWVTTGSGTTGRATGETDAASLDALLGSGIEGVLVDDVSFTKSILETLK